MVLFSGTPKSTGIPAPSPMQSEAVGDRYVTVGVKEGTKIEDEIAKDGVPSVELLKLESEGNEIRVVCIDAKPEEGIEMKPEDGTEVVVSSHV